MCNNMPRRDFLKTAPAAGILTYAVTAEGCTFQEDAVFANLVGYIERGEIRPAVARTYPLAEIVTAQKDFLAKNFTGKLVLVPPGDEAQ